MRNYIYIFFLLVFSSCANSGGSLEVDDADQPRVPIEFKFSDSSLSIEETKRQGSSGNNFEVGDTLLIGQYIVKADGTRDNSAAHASCYYTVQTYDAVDERITSVVPVSSGTPLATLTATESPGGKAFYTIISGGCGEAFPLSVFDNVDQKVTLDYDEMNYNYDVLTQSTSSASSAELITFDAMEHLCSQVNIMIHNPNNLIVDSVTLQRLGVTEEFTPVYSSQVEYYFNSQIKLSQGYQFMYVGDEAEGVDYRGFFLPYVAKDDSWVPSYNIWFYFNGLDTDYPGKIGFFIGIKAGYSYDVRVSATAIAAKAGKEQVVVKQIGDIVERAY